MSLVAKTPGTLLKSDEIKSNIKRKFYDVVFAIGFLCCLVPGGAPGLVPIVSLVLLLCITVSFFDENFYIYTALFMYMRYEMLVGDTPVYRFYSYLVVLKFMTEFLKLKFRIVYIPTLFVLFLHSIFAVPKIESLRIGLNVIVDCVIVYIVLLKVLQNDDLMRKFLFAFLLGGVTSGVYGWLNKDVSVDINVSGAGAHTVNRNFGALGDSNFAGLFYSLCIIVTIVLKKIPLFLRGIFLAIFAIILLQTASLSALLVLSVLSAFLVILKYRAKSAIILFLVGFGAIVGITLLLTIPQFRQISAIAGLIIRIEEKLSYIPRGRWDLLTTDRSAIWGTLYAVFMGKPIWGKLIGGSVITVYALDKSISSMACHNSYLQSIMNFGIIGSLIIYVPLVSTFCYRIYNHFSKKPDYENQDIKMNGKENNLCRL